MKKFLALFVLLSLLLAACQAAPVSPPPAAPPGVAVATATTASTSAPSPAPATSTAIPPTATPDPSAQCGILPPAAITAPAASPNPPLLIPRQTLFNIADKTGVSISRDGTKIAYRAPTGGALNIWVAPVDNIAAAQPVSNFRRGIRGYSWAYTNKHLVFAEDQNGDENFQVYVADVESRQTRQLTALAGVRVSVQRLSEKLPNEILITLNDRDKNQFDLQRLNLETGARTLVLQSDNFAGYVTDDDFNVRFVLKYTSDGGKEYLKRNTQGTWESYLRISPVDEDTTYTAGIDRAGKTILLVDSRNRNTGALTRLDLDTGAQTVVAENVCSDVGGWLEHPVTREIQAISFTYERRRWQVLDKSVAEDLAYLQSVTDGDLSILSRSPDLKRWVVSYVADNGPLRYYLYDRDAKKATYLFSNQQALENLPFAKTHPVVIKSRDGLNLVSYVTLPLGSNPRGDIHPDKPLPMVLNVHGGPWSRDTWGLDSEAQWLANRGYAVLNVNYRGSEGFGKTFLNAGDREWGGKMHDDLIDAVNWAIKERIADPNKICIMGGSYGGYAVLVGMTFTPDVFACGVDLVGISNLNTFMNNLPPNFLVGLDLLKKRIGDPSTDAGKNFLASRSPLTYVDRIKKPLLIGQGANDPRVKKSEADQIVQAMQAKNIPVTYLLYPDEGHGFSRASNARSYNAVVEAFLGVVLGGRVEPLGSDLSNSSVTVPVGVGLIPGLANALGQK